LTATFSPASRSRPGDAAWPEHPADRARCRAANTANEEARRGERKPLLVRRASADELACHEQILPAIDMESKGTRAWPLKEAIAQ